MVKRGDALILWSNALYPTHQLTLYATVRYPPAASNIIFMFAVVYFSVRNPQQCYKLADPSQLRWRRGARALNKFLRGFGPGSVDPDVASVKERGKRGRAHSLCAPERLYAATVRVRVNGIDTVSKPLRLAHSVPSKLPFARTRPFPSPWFGAIVRWRGVVAIAMVCFA